MASLPLMVLVGSVFCVLFLALSAVRRRQSAGAGRRNRPALRGVSFATDGAAAPTARSGRRMLAPERPSVTRRRRRQHAVPLQH